MLQRIYRPHNLEIMGLRATDRSVGRDEFGLAVGRVTVAGDDGVERRRSYLHAPDAVAVVAVHNGELILVREFRAAVGESVLSVPMGKIPDGTDPRTQALAELAEETGFRAYSCEPVACLLSAPGWTDQRTHVFRATGLTALAERPAGGDPDDVEEQGIVVVAVPVDAIAGLVVSGALRDARTIAAIHVAALAL
jgi:ADP-ribose pyrophosphatase